MKKSEMIDRIDEEIRCSISKEWIEMVLDLAIKHGMLPPYMEFEMGGTTVRDVGWDKEDGQEQKTRQK